MLMTAILSYKSIQVYLSIQTPKRNSMVIENPKSQLYPANLDISLTITSLVPS